MWSGGRSRLEPDIGIPESELALCQSPRWQPSCFKEEGISCDAVMTRPHGLRCELVTGGPPKNSANFSGWQRVKWFILWQEERTKCVDGKSDGESRPVWSPRCSGGWMLRLLGFKALCHSTGLNSKQSSWWLRNMLQPPSDAILKLKTLRDK